MKGLFFIASRLKLYDTTIEVCINKKVKEKLRKIAYKKKITMSEYVRYLINFIIACNDLNSLNLKKDISNQEIDKLVILLGGKTND